MLAARLRARCPSARVIGRAEATGFHLTFDKIGQDGSGKATLVPGDGVVPGVLFDLAAEDVHLLDRIEGLGRGYDRVMLDLGGQGVMAYLAPAPDRGLGAAGRLTRVACNRAVPARYAGNGGPPATD